MRIKKVSAPGQPTYWTRESDLDRVYLWLLGAAIVGILAWGAWE